MEKHGDSRLTKQMIEELFYDFNNLLSSENMKVDLVICGGSVMVMYDARNMTADIDSAHQLSTKYTAMLQFIGQKYDLDEDWLNDYSYDPLPKGLEYELLSEYSNLTIHKLTDVSMLVAKIAASRAKDLEDAKFFIERLSINKKEEVFKLCEKYNVELMYTNLTDNRLKNIIINRLQFIDKIFDNYLF